MKQNWTSRVDPDQLTRERGLERLRAFEPHMGWDYARERNLDRGPLSPSTVSGLSPYVRRRLVTEQELVDAALSAHGPEAAAKFVEEVLWRGYFRGWLENRPQVWRSYQVGLTRDLEQLARDANLSTRYSEALEGRTGIDCFDAWAQELMETGTLHNHARMWFASIWCFTLRLPWRLGADFFYRHLLDGDAASNTLSWRWVAGLHTRGKTYLARADNIKTYTGGRFSPRPGDLASHAEPLLDEEPGGHPDIERPREPTAVLSDQRTALILTEDDCRFEEYDAGALPICGVATVSVGHRRSVLPASDAVLRSEHVALTDQLARLSKGAAHPATHFLSEDLEGLLDWILREGATQVILPYCPVGPTGDWLAGLGSLLRPRQIAVAEWLRPWDQMIWPHATGSYFKVKQRIPSFALAASCRGLRG